MSLRRLKNVPKKCQERLSVQFSWLDELSRMAELDRRKFLWVSVFDHWLSRADADVLLGDISQEEEFRRETLLEKFCSELVSDTEALSFAMRGNRKRKAIFRTFKSRETLLSYCKPNGSSAFRYRRNFGFRHRHFRVALPDFGCTFHESWDYTYFFYCTSKSLEEAARRWAARSGVYILSAPPD